VLAAYPRFSIVAASILGNAEAARSIQALPGPAVNWRSRHCGRRRSNSSPIAAPTPSHGNAGCRCLADWRCGSTRYQNRAPCGLGLRRLWPKRAGHRGAAIGTGCHLFGVALRRIEGSPRPAQRRTATKRTMRHHGDGGAGRLWRGERDRNHLPYSDRDLTKIDSARRHCAARLRALVVDVHLSPNDQRGGRCRAGNGQATSAS